MPPARVAMFVMNPCHGDARVRKEAASLGQAGYSVRVFGLGNSTWPAGVHDEGDFEIERVEVTSTYQRILLGLGRLYRREVSWVGGRALVAIFRILLAPLAALLVFGRIIGRAVAGVSTRGLGMLAGLASGLLAPSTSLHDLDDAAGREVDLGRLHAIAARVKRTLRRLLRRAHRAVRRGAALPVGFGYRMQATTKRLTRRTRRAFHRGSRWIYLRAVRFVRRRLLVLHRPSVYAEFWKDAGAAAARWRPDVVHAHDLNALPAAMRAAKARGIPIVYDSHELWRHRNRVTRFHPIGRLFDRFQERRLIRKVDLVVTVGGYIERWLQDTYRLPAERTRVVRNVPLSREASSAGAPALRELAGLPHERIILYTGRVTSGRGLEEAIVALASLPEDVHLVMLGYGDQEYLEELYVRARGGGVDSRLHLLAPVSSHQVPAVASGADVALVAIQPLCLSYRYALPNKLFEAIQGRVPVVASDLPEIRTVVQTYGVGELFTIGDAAQFARAVASVLADASGYLEGLERAAQELRWEVEREILVNAYSTLMASRDYGESGRPVPVRTAGRTAG